MSLLPIDTAMQFPHVYVIPASAGSGKTYTLSHRYVQFLLSDNIHANGIRNILAITFTKLAAKEMKERIITVLKEAALNNERTVNELSLLLDMPAETIVLRSQRAIEEILRNYSDFNVRTIDSFLTTIFTASSLELGVQPNVSIEFNHDAILEQAFRNYSQSLQEGSESVRLIDELIGVIESNDTTSKGYLWNPFAKIVREVRELQKQFGRYAHQPKVIDGTGRLADLRTRIIQRSATLVPMLEKTTLPVNVNFSKEIARLANGDVLTIASKGKTKKYFNAYSDDAGAAKEIKRLFSVITPLEKDLQEYITVYAHNYYQPFVRAVTLVERSVRDVKVLEGSVVIDDINRFLAQYLSLDIVPEVYVKLGERIAHFMIDEFQDTSPIQWKNLYPLLEEALSKQGSLFAVGDTKQSIYGFRGADWHIFRDLIHQKFFPSAPASVVPLTTNYRSAQALVDFVKDVFSVHIVSAHLEEYANASGLYNFAQDVPISEQQKGYVEVRLIRNDDAQASAIEQRDFILATIGDCLGRKYSYGDIAILTQTNADVVEISSWLNDGGIPFLSMSTLDIRKRKIVGEILALLRFLDSPIDDLSFTTFLTGEIFGRTVPHLSFEEKHAFILQCSINGSESTYRTFRSRYGAEWEKYFDRLFALVGYMPLYDLVSEVYKTYDIFTTCPAEESALVKLLECIKKFENSGSNSLKDFLSFSMEEGSDGWSIDVPGSVDAVRIMTVHKAKGLGFPVALVVLKEKRPRASAMVTVETDDGVSVIRVGKNYGERNAMLGTVYDHREKEAVIDELNKIYVALTRARKEMYVLSVFKKKENLPASILDGRIYGTKYPSAEKGAEIEKPSVIQSVYRVQRSIVPVAQYEKISLDETRRGDAIHSILSRIEFCSFDSNNDIAGALRDAPLPAGFDIPKEQSNLISFLETPAVKTFFAMQPGRKVFREKEIADAGGRLFRMDRIIIDPDNICVADFKTGNDAQNEEYTIQVRRYMTMVKEIFPVTMITGALLYVDLRKVVPVV